MLQFFDRRLFACNDAKGQRSLPELDAWKSLVFLSVNGGMWTRCDPRAVVSVSSQNSVFLLEMTSSREIKP